MNRSLLKLLLVLSALALATTATGCKKFKKTPADAGAAPTAGDDGEGDTETDDDKNDEKLSMKVGEYIRNCMNTMSSPIYHSRRMYASWAPKSGPTGKERVRRSFSSANKVGHIGSYGTISTCSRMSSAMRSVRMFVRSDASFIRGGPHRY